MKKKNISMSLNEITHRVYYVQEVSLNFILPHSLTYVFCWNKQGMEKRNVLYLSLKPNFIRLSCLLHY